MLRAELYRAFGNKFFFLSLALGIGIAVAHIFQFVIPTSIEESAYIYDFPASAFTRWIGGWSYPVHPDLFYLVSPLLAALPFGWSFSADWNSGYANQVFARARRWQFLLAKVLASFASAGVAVIAPLIINFLGTACVLPLITPHVTGIGSFMVLPMYFMGDLFFENPLAYLGTYLSISFIAAGLMGCLCFPASLLLSNKYVVICFPFVLCTILASFTSRTSWYSLAPTSFIRAGQDFGPLVPNQALIFCGLAIGVIGFGLLLASRKDYLS